MKNREIFEKDPLEREILNNGVAVVKDTESADELRTLRYEIETFVCDGQYACGLGRILHSFLSSLGRPEQPAVWISGFYGSGKSHLPKMLRVLWIDYKFPGDGATARGLAQLPDEIKDLLRELTAQGRVAGGLHAASGTLKAQAGENVRLSLLPIVFRSCGLPEQHPHARFVIGCGRHAMAQPDATRLSSTGPLRMLRAAKTLKTMDFVPDESQMRNWQRKIWRNDVAEFESWQKAGRLLTPRQQTLREAWRSNLQRFPSLPAHPQKTPPTFPGAESGATASGASFSPESAPSASRPASAPPS
ncbi:MAG: hypothetical protein NTW86_08940 [Candidatus Sumerlaeota bacterium]|nr:hypothetical protein [Candidatus Sumerlaeota bacterium]